MGSATVGQNLQKIFCNSRESSRTRQVNIKTENFGLKLGQRKMTLTECELQH